jgi:(S)-ureidoglycine aminohydrolase
MEISALTRSVVKSNHAIIAPDGYINSKVPGWSNCTVNVIINEAMGAGLCQTIVTAGKDCRLVGATKESELFIYVIKGKARAIISGGVQVMSSGHFAYVPPQKHTSLKTSRKAHRYLLFIKNMNALKDTRCQK